MNGSEKMVIGAGNRHFEVVEKPRNGISNAGSVAVPKRCSSDSDVVQDLSNNRWYCVEPMILEPLVSHGLKFWSQRGQ